MIYCKWLLRGACLAVYQIGEGAKSNQTSFDNDQPHSIFFKIINENSSELPIQTINTTKTLILKILESVLHHYHQGNYIIVAKRGMELISVINIH